MEIDSLPCKSCGGTDWRKSFSDSYPERRRDRDKTVKTVYVCQGCGAEGKYFEHQHEGTEQLSGALRQ